MEPTVSTVHDSPQTLAATPARPLVADTSRGRIIAWRGGQGIGVASFLADVAALAERLPAAPAAVNLCEERYAFLVAFAALLVRSQVNLLPPSRARHAIERALRAYPASYTLGDVRLRPAPPDYLWFRPGHRRDAPPLAVAADAVAAIGYTSGSTGAPRAHPLQWRRLAISSGQQDALLRSLAGARYHLVATVPAQHMYGLEFSVLLPLFGHAAVHTGRPFYPADITAALRDLPEPRVLVTTPVHLRALIAAEQPLPPLAAIVSATAPLPCELARQAERQFQAPLEEIFGSTETGAIAYRRTAVAEPWTPHPGVTLHPQPDGTRFEAPQLVQPVVLADVVELEDDGHFRLCGRAADALEIAGKRASLGDLTRKLLAIPGVRDGVVLQLDAADSMGIRRIAALAVAPGLDERAIVDALRAEIDPVFLPRRIQLVDALPRSDTGKLPRAAVLEALKTGTRDPAPGSGNPG
jgi:acyl-coenzyme A synthetase/AMP-(fatty) acid ligase